MKVRQRPADPFHEARRALDARETTAHVIADVSRAARHRGDRAIRNRLRDLDKLDPRRVGTTVRGHKLTHVAAGAVMYNFAAQLADVDRGVYEDITLRAARHPSETEAYMMTRVLAYCLEYVEGITFSEGISSTNEPAVLVRDLTGRLTTWIEVGAPDAERLHYASKLADRTTVYTHRDPQKVIAAWAGKRIHQLEQITVQSFDPGFMDAAVAVLERRNTMTVSRVDGQLYLDLNGTTLSSVVCIDELG